MPIDPASRSRLADAMDDRRRELRLRWQDVADRGRVSLKALLNARTGPADIRPLTQRAIEDGLQWPSGYVQDILDGKNAPASLREAPPPAFPGQADEPARIPRGVSNAIGDLVADLVPIIEAETRRAQMRHPGAELSGRDIFADKHEAAIWDIPGLGNRYEVIALLRAVRQHGDAGENGTEFPRNAR